MRRRSFRDSDFAVSRYVGLLSIFLHDVSKVVFDGLEFFADAIACAIFELVMQQPTEFPG